MTESGLGEGEGGGRYDQEKINVTYISILEILSWVTTLAFAATEFSVFAREQ